MRRRLQLRPSRSLLRDREREPVVQQRPWRLLPRRHPTRYYAVDLVVQSLGSHRRLFLPHRPLPCCSIAGRRWLPDVRPPRLLSGSDSMPSNPAKRRLQKVLETRLAWHLEVARRYPSGSALSVARPNSMPPVSCYLASVAMQPLRAIERFGSHGESPDRPIASGWSL